MNEVIIRHDLSPGPDAEQFAERLSERVARRIDKLEGSAKMIDYAFSTANLAMRAHCVADPRAAAVETWESTVNSMQLGSAIFALLGAAEGAVECRINRKLRTIPATGPMSTADAGTWLSAFWLAVICRDQDRMTQHSEIPLERLRSPEGSYDKYIYHWVDTLQSWWLRRPDLADKLIATIEASDPTVARIAPQDLLQAVLYPRINLFYHYVRNDRDGFTPALADALKLHKTYWTLNKDRAKDSRQKFHCPCVWRNGSNMSRFTVHIAEPPPSPVLHIVSASVAAVQAPHRPQVKGRSRFPRTAA